MKVVLFCGGLGLRLRDYNDQIPKPMINVGYRPILWNVMKYYAHYGHKDFILLLGYKADVIKEYFINYKEYLSNDFIFSEGGKNLELLNTDISDWHITFVDTGINSSVGERLYAARNLLKNEEVFLANYTDGLSDLPLNQMIDDFMKTEFIAAFMAYQPNYTYHIVSFDGGSEVKNIIPMTKSDVWINTGYFVLRNEIFNYLKKGEELVVEPFKRLIKEHKLMAHKYKGFWQCIDTYKDKQQIDDMYASGHAPWEVWKNNNRGH